MRIVLMSDTIPPETPGGAGIMAWRLAQGLRAAGHDVFVIAATQRRPFAEARDGIATVHLHSRYPVRVRAWLSLYNPQLVGPLARLLDEWKPDVVNAHNIHHHLSYHALTLAHRRGIRTVFSSHDAMPFAYTKLSHFIDPADLAVPSVFDYRLPPGFNRRQNGLRWNPWRNQRIRHVLTAHTDARTAPSAALAQALRQNGLPDFQVVPNGLDPASLLVRDDVVAKLRDELGLAGRRVVLVAGRLTRPKGTDQLLAAMDLVMQEAPDALLLVLAAQPPPGLDGDWPYAHLKREQIVLAGWRQSAELAAAYHLADVVVSPSVIFESFGLVNLEAMAARKPVVTTCFGGAREVVLDGETGYVVNPFNIGTLAERLLGLLRDEGLRAAMGRAGRTRLEAEYTLDHMVARMLALYQAQP
jgi:glycosyltransferase involved in cell wall biosynthesis